MGSFKGALEGSKKKEAGREQCDRGTWHRTGGSIDETSKNNTMVLIFQKLGEKWVRPFTDWSSAYNE